MSSVDQSEILKNAGVKFSPIPEDPQLKTVFAHVFYIENGIATQVTTGSYQSFSFIVDPSFPNLFEHISDRILALILKQNSWPKIPVDGNIRIDFIGVSPSGDLSFHIFKNKV